MGTINTSLVRLHAPYGAAMRFVGDKRPTAAAKRKRIALHEAAHAIAAKAYGLQLRYAELDVDEGQVRHARARNQAPWAHAVISLAGPCAGVVFSAAYLPAEGAESDFIDARKHAQEIDSHNSNRVMDQAWAAALQIVRDNYTVISYLAAVLTRTGRLSGTEIDSIIGKVRPGPSRPCGGE